MGAEQRSAPRHICTILSVLYKEFRDRHFLVDALDGLGKHVGHGDVTDLLAGGDTGLGGMVSRNTTSSMTLSAMRWTAGPESRP